jgi:5-methylcytosine-specific restriction endonuclease McrA
MIGSDEKTIDLIKKMTRYTELDYRLSFRELYMAYQRSKYWNKVVQEVRLRDNNRCRDCGQTKGKLIVHHTNYDNWGYGDYEEMKDCVLVCQKCHDKRHRYNSINVPFWAWRNGESSRQEEIQNKETINGFGL